MGGAGAREAEVPDWALAEKPREDEPGSLASLSPPTGGLLGSAGAPRVGGVSSP
jgi:hypothetical protein